MSFHIWTCFPYDPTDAPPVGNITLVPGILFLGSGNITGAFVTNPQAEANHGTRSFSPHLFLRWLALELAAINSISLNTI